MRTPTRSDVLAALAEITDPAAREQLLVEAVQLGLHDPIYFATVATAWGPHKASLIVGARPLSVDGVFVPVTARAQLRIADALRCVLPTPKILRLMHEQAAVQIEPYTRPTTDGMRSVQATREASAEVQARIAHVLAARPDIDEHALVSVFGKSWVVTRAGQDWITKVPNMGLATPCGPMPVSAPVHWIQMPQRDPDHAHNAFHDDYSQLCYLVHNQCVVDSDARDITEVLKDPTLHRLVADDGPLHDFRPFEMRVEPMDPQPLPSFPIVNWGAFDHERVLPMHYLPDAIRTPGLVVIHSAETDETRDAAPNVARWFKTGPFPNGPASVHWIVDAEHIVAAVPEEQVAYGAKGANHDGIHLEIAGRANQGPAGWLDAYSQAALARAALVTAQACKRWGIPLRWLDANALKDPMNKGITTHAGVTHGRKMSSHLDPGLAFPVVRFLRMVDAAYASLA